MSSDFGSYLKTKFRSILEPPPLESRPPFSRYLDVIALTSFALVQPALDHLAANPRYLSDLAIQLVVVLLFLAIFCIGPPAVIIGLELLAGLFGPRVRRWVENAVVLVLLTVFLLPIVGRIRFLSGGSVVLASGLALLGLFCYRRIRPARMVVTWCSIGWLVFPAVFLFHSPVTKVLFPAEQTKLVRMEIENPVPIVMIVFDEFCGTSIMNEQREIDPIRYPNFAALSQKATWYRNASTVSHRSHLVLPAILSGKYPSDESKPREADKDSSLFTLLLEAKRHEVVVFEPYSRMFPLRADPDVVRADGVANQLRTLSYDMWLVFLDHVTPTDYKLYLPRIRRQWFALTTAPDVRPEKKRGLLRYAFDLNRDRQIAHFKDCLYEGEKPGFYFAHIAIPHFPWRYLPSGKKYRLDSGMERPDPMGVRGEHGETWCEAPWAVTQGFQRYLLQIGYVDRMVGQIVRHLEEVGLFDRSLIILVADHGIAFHPNLSRRIPTELSLPDIMSVPLFVKLPHQSVGGVSDRNVEVTDLLPTILDVLGASPRPKVDGQSLLNETPERTEKQIWVEGKHIVVDKAFGSKWRTLDQMLELFGSGSRPDALFQVGPHQELLGKRLGECTIDGMSRVKVERNAPADFDYDESSELVPCQLVGRVLNVPPAELPVYLAIAVNGVIRVVTHTYKFDQRDGFWAGLISEQWIRLGSNEVEVLVISEEEGKLLLRRAATDFKPPPP